MKNRNLKSKSMGMLAFAVLLASAVPSFARSSGGETGGGGDVFVIEFKNTLQKTMHYLLENVDVAPEADREQMYLATQALSQSLGSLSSASLIEFTQKRPIDRFGVEKAAVFTKNPLKVRVHLGSWLQYSSAEKVTLVGMELLGLGGLQTGRYDAAFDELSPAAEEILSIDVNAEKLAAFSKYAKIEKLFNQSTTPFLLDEMMLSSDKIKSPFRTCSLIQEEQTVNLDLLVGVKLIERFTEGGNVYQEYVYPALRSIGYIKDSLTQGAALGSNGALNVTFQRDLNQKAGNCLGHDDTTFREYGVTNMQAGLSEDGTSYEISTHCNNQRAEIAFEMRKLSNGDLVVKRTVGMDWDGNGYYYCKR